MICAFFVYAKSRFSHDVAYSTNLQIQLSNPLKHFKQVAKLCAVLREILSLGFPSRSDMNRAVQAQ